MSAMGSNPAVAARLLYVRFVEHNVFVAPACALRAQDPRCPRNTKAQRTKPFTCRSVVLKEAQESLRERALAESCGMLVERREWTPCQLRTPMSKVSRRRLK